MEEDVKRPICKHLNYIETLAILNLIELWGKEEYSLFWSALEDVNRLVALAKSVCKGVRDG
ncbi:MAG: hypothetical protein JRD89_20435 [Deltaproteobacteria bacterium]|nr:hypothetical protein [Deltaproteobacteria bacterium]